MTTNEEKSAKLAKAFEDFLRAVERSPGTYPELLNTPVRASSMWLDDLLDGYDWSPADILAGGTPVEAGRGLVIVRDLFFHSVCPHHLLPYHGQAFVAYVPGDRVVGFSKINRLVDCFAHRLILQEEIAQLVAQALVEHLGARGAGCVLDAEQLCMVVRGVRKPGSRAVTSSYAGSMADDQGLRMEFLTTIGTRESSAR
jgi:GTP cyclohydrolase I